MEQIVDTQQAITVAIRPCLSCGSGIPETDRFCRLCGQSQQAGQTIEIARRSGVGDLAVTEGAVSSISAALVTRLSDQLVSGSVACVFSIGGGRPGGTYAPRIKRIVSVLVSVPVWLIIVVLSPFDAYAMARLITDARWQRERI
jgi:hypothetical protein